LILTAAEKERDRRQRLANAKKEFLGVEKQKEVEKTTGSRNSSSSSHHHHHVIITAETWGSIIDIPTILPNGCNNNNTAERESPKEGLRRQRKGPVNRTLPHRRPQRASEMMIKMTTLNIYL
jgi:hypothetical protein